MKNLLPITFAFGCLLVLPISSVAQSDNTPTMQMSHGELKKLERQAESPAQFKMLANYYRQKEVKFSARAADEKLEWDRRSKVVTGPMAKPPRPVDSAQSLYQYYQQEADQAAKLASHYEKRSETHMAANATAE
jgi:hypothetical protein